MNPELYRVFSAILYGLAALLATLQAAGIPQTAEGWIGVVVSFLIASWGKYSSSQTLVAPNREAWTPEQRVANKQ